MPRGHVTPKHRDLPLIAGHRGLPPRRSLFWELALKVQMLGILPTSTRGGAMVLICLDELARITTPIVCPAMHVLIIRELSGSSTVLASCQPEAYQALMFRMQRHIITGTSPCSTVGTIRSTVGQEYNCHHGVPLLHGSSRQIAAKFLKLEQ